MENDSLYLFPISKNDELIKAINFYMPDEAYKKYLSYHKVEDRNNFIASRWIINALALNFNKNVLFGAYEYKQNGKPFLSNFKSFNISHTDGLVAVIVSSKDVGVDTEKIIPINDINLVQNYFSEFEMYEITSSKNRSNTFYYYWTIKEALIKYSGKGISELEYLKNMTFFKNNEILHEGIIYYTESFIFRDYMISCARLKYSNTEPIKVFECYIDNESSLKFKEIKYRRDIISIL